MLKQPLFSVIIPIYNAEKYLQRAVSSVINQTYADWEIILINDGSTDNSLKICRESAKIDPRINTISLTKNSGPYHARNTGLKKAAGEYVLFVDADDHIEADLLRQITLRLTEEKAEVVVFGMRESYLDRVGNCRKNSFILPDEEGFYRSQEQISKCILSLEENTLFRYAHGKAYKRDWLITNGLWFRNLPMIEDVDFNLRVFDVIDNLRVMRLAGYCYERRPTGSQTSLYVPDYFELHMDLLEKKHKQFVKWDMQEEAQVYLAEGFLKYVFLSLQMTFSPKCNAREEKQNEILKQTYTAWFYKKLQSDAIKLRKKYQILWRLLKTKNKWVIIPAAHMLYVLKNKQTWLWIRIK